MWSTWEDSLKLPKYDTYTENQNFQYTLTFKWSEVIFIILYQYTNISNYLKICVIKWYGKVEY